MGQGHYGPMGRPMGQLGGYAVLFAWAGRCRNST